MDSLRTRSVRQIEKFLAPFQASNQFQLIHSDNRSCFRQIGYLIFLMHAISLFSNTRECKRSIVWSLVHRHVSSIESLSICIFGNSSVAEFQNMNHLHLNQNYAKNTTLSEMVKMLIEIPVMRTIILRIETSAFFSSKSRKFRCLRIGSE